MLMLLAEGDRNGYELMREVEERSGGAWRPSPGSVYPTLSVLERDRLVERQTKGGRRVFSITDAGRACLINREPAPWQRIRAATPAHARDLRQALDRLTVAVEQVAHVGTLDECRQARELLAGTTRALYLMLADERL